MRILLVVLLTGIGLVSGGPEAAPPPGHPSTDQASELMGIGRQTQMNAQGEVVKAVDSNAYTYIQVRSPQGELRWLAAPRLSLRAGQQIRFPEGVMMSNFYSKKLKHQFAQIWFVPSVELLQEP